MGLWSWFNRKKARTTSVDRIWLSDAAHLAGLTKELTAAVRPVLLVAHFPATLKRVCGALEEQGIVPTILGPTITVKQLDQLAAQGTERIIYAGVVRQLESEPLPSVDKPDPRLLEIVVAERHFLHSADEAILRFAEGLEHRCHVTFHLSLEAPLLRQFAGDWVRPMLERLGMAEDECLESAMVNRRIRNAQDRIAKRVDVPRDTASADAWLLENGFEE
jgi:hypothetical protein